MKTTVLDGVLLDEWVARARGEAPGAAYSSDWCHGGPVIERERISINPPDAEGRWWSDYPNARECLYGRTPLIAAMRAFVASKFGDEVPEQL